MLREQRITHEGKTYALEPAVDFCGPNTGRRGTYQTGRYLVGEIVPNRAGADEYRPLGMSVGSVAEFLAMLK